MATTEFGNGIHKLRTAMLIYLVGSILGFAGFFVGLLPRLSMGATSSAALAGGITYLIILVIGLILGLVALLLMRGGFKTLKKSDPAYGIGVTGTLLEIVGIIFVGIAAVLLIITVAGAASSTASAVFNSVGAIAGVFATLGLIIIGGIISFVGVILTMIGFFRIGSKYSNALVQVGAVLYLFIAFVGVILLFIGLNEIEKKN